MHTSQQRGALGESLAAAFLESRGYRILERHFRAARREIDLIAERGELLVAIEVKWRRGGSDLERSHEAWRAPQRARAGEAVLGAMTKLEGGAARPWRFDLITIDEEPRGLRLEHWPGAWAPRNSWW